MYRDPKIVENEVMRSEVSSEAWYRRVSWGAIFAGVVVALLTQLALEMLGIAIGVGAIEPGEDTLGPDFTSAVVVWLAATMLLSLFAGGLVTGKLSGTSDASSGLLQGLTMMGVTTLITLFLLSSTLMSTLRGVSGLIGDGLSFVGSNAEDVATTVADAVELRDNVLVEIRDEAEDILAEDASLTSLRIALDDYLLGEEPGQDVRQAAITALASQTELTQEEAAAQLDEWEADLDQAVTNLEEEAERVASDVADIIAATAGVIFAMLVAGAFAGAAGGYVAVASWNAPRSMEQTVVRRQTAEVTS